MGSSKSGRRVPKERKIIRGTFRNDRNPAEEPEPTIVDKVPSCPPHLGRHAKAIWKRLAPEMVRAGVLTVVDVPALEILCSTYQDYRDAREAVFLNEKGKPQTLRQYLRGRNSQTMPEYNALKAAYATYKSYAVEFGLTPSSRNRIDLKPAKAAEADPMEELLDGG